MKILSSDLKFWPLYLCPWINSPTHLQPLIILYMI